MEGESDYRAVSNDYASHQYHSRVAFSRPSQAKTTTTTTSRSLLSICDFLANPQICANSVNLNHNFNSRKLINLLIESVEQFKLVEFSYIQPDSTTTSEIALNYTILMQLMKSSIPMWRSESCISY